MDEFVFVLAVEASGEVATAQPAPAETEPEEVE
jgi:hypothetical protein